MQSKHRRRLIVDLDLLAALGFVLLAFIVVNTDLLTAVDHTVMQWVLTAPSTALSFSLWIAAVTSLSISSLLMGLVAAVIWYTHGWRTAVIFSLTALAAFLSFNILKEILEIPRPAGSLLALDSYGFPSGHTTMAFFLAGALGCLGWRTARHRQTTHKRWGYRSILLLVLYSGATVVALSRLLTSVHSFSDVLAGTLLGTFFALLFCSLTRACSRDQLE